jgi:ribonuclease P protein component
LALHRSHRLKRRQDFSVVYKKGQRTTSVYLTLRVLRMPLPQAEQAFAKTVPTRIGIVVSQKVSKRAVVRNRIKRQLRAIVSLLLPEFATGWDVIIAVHPQAKECEYNDFLQELKQLLVLAEVIHGHTRGCVL